VSVVVVGVLTGLTVWSLLEYLVHRFAMHQMRGRGVISRLHRRHHAQASWRFERVFLANWAIMVGLGFVVGLPLGIVTGGVRLGFGMASGWAVGYAYYVFEHAAIHVRPARTGYGAWLRRHHLHHHFGHSKKNYGVTSPLWDLVFGTYERPEVVRVPRRKVPPWLFDGQGVLRRRYEGHYQVVQGVGVRLGQGQTRPDPSLGGRTSRDTARTRPTDGEAARSAWAAALNSCRATEIASSVRTKWSSPSR
jgi:hypothetical protein